MSLYSKLDGFDSSDFTDIVDSVAHSKSNKFVLPNISTVINYKNEIEITDENILSKYDTIIMDCTYRTEIDSKFFYKPELLAKQMYGTVDLWYLVLWVNKMSSMYEFNKKYIYVFNPSKISVLNDLIELERENLATSQESPTYIEDLTIMKVPISE